MSGIFLLHNLWYGSSNVHGITNCDYQCPKSPSVAVSRLVTHNSCLSGGQLQLLTCFSKTFSVRYKILAMRIFFADFLFILRNLYWITKIVLTYFDYFYRQKTAILIKNTVHTVIKQEPTISASQCSSRQWAGQLQVQSHFWSSPSLTSVDTRCSLLGINWPGCETSH